MFNTSKCLLVVSASAKSILWYVVNMHNYYGLVAMEAASDKPMRISGETHMYTYLSACLGTF